VKSGKKDNKMKKNIEETKFEKVYDEIMFEIKDVIDLLSHVLGQSSKADSVLDLLVEYSHGPANDNWPLYEKQENEIINVNVK